MADRPGVLFYFSDWRSIARRLNTEQRGELVSAVMSFAETGEVPDLHDQMTAFAFDLLAEKVVRDGERYQERCLKNAHNTYQRECKKHGETPLPFDEWASSDVKRYRSIPTDIKTIQPERETQLETETETELERERELGRGTRGNLGENAPLSPDAFNDRRNDLIAQLRNGPPRP